ncbi:DNA polymerase-3 subunit alpha [Catalinimonas alkaloidigena]|uniref:DNA polymerase III subunit alpha n=1 Tax=Catalinimonas alkaloidigena TaxID=1075417 RepID=UPI002406810B|nr:DNA polymerase III subunit alpha [Catalinimonas alkaloidigena]MDF9799843.1 DNA polymerase-3 subunit alpha [Catalinimonas alkaloidigena]
MYLIFDTETTGLPRDYNAPITDLDNWPRIVQLSWQLHAADGKLLNQQDYIVKPVGFTIPFNSEKVHGISTERALKEGHPLEKVLEIFNKDLERTQVVIGHNVDFDINITGAELVRTGLPTHLMDIQKLDTKDESTDFCKIPGGRGGRYKWPTLSELHQKLFGVGFDEAHNSAFDVDATARCFFGLLKEKVVKPYNDEVPLDKIIYEAPDLEAASRAEKEKKESEAPTIPLSNEPVKEIKTAPFSHLHVHSQYSILQSTASLKNIVAAAKEQGMPAVAITDLGSLFGAFKAVAEGKRQGLKVIIGCDVYVVEDRHQKKFTKDMKDQRSLQLLLAKNQEGYQNLSKLCSLGYIEGYYGGFPRVDKELIQRYKHGLIATTGSISGEVPDLILNVGEHQAEEAFVWWKETFGEDFYVELQRHGLEEENRVNDILLRFAKKYNVKVIATNDVYYTRRADADAHDTLLCVKNGDVMSMPKGRGRGFRFGMPNDEFYFKTEEEMKRLFQDLPEAITNTYEIVEKTEELKLERDILLPRFEIPEEFEDQDDYLRHLAYEGAKSHYGEVTPEISERIDHELKIIKDMGFPGYFLIVQDFINAARKMGVKVGPGRGSAAGSVVAYCTGITNIDPIEYDLLFERFLNPERISMPDIDIDFDDDGRQKVIDYVIKKYGRNQVAQIVTFGTMAPKMSIRDVARVSELPLPEANRIAKLVPEKPGTTFEQALAEVPELQQIKRGRDKQSEVVNLAQTLVGSVRGTGIHAAGVIIAPDDLLEYIPVKTDKDSDLFITQFDGSVVESAGMLKMDFLGLKTLTIIKTALENIKQNHGIEIDIDTIPLDDEETYKLYQRGDTVGTFQFESDGMRQWLQKLKPTNIEDLIAMNALYRPGPMQFIPNFIDRKHGREQVEYPHPLLEGILKNTYGIMVYQEQIMQTAQILGGYSLGGADLLRRAMGKKKIEEMNKQREIFVKGAKEKHGIEKGKAEEVFSIMEKFAQYGFNRSHSAAYSVVAYQTGYLKANYPAEYMAAVLTHNMNNSDKVTAFLDECKRQGINVLGPDVNESRYFFGVNKEGQIRFGLGAVKGAGENAVSAIIEERDGEGLYKDIFEFTKRINLRQVNKKTLEVLAMAGAFDCFDGLHRRQYLHTEEGDASLIEKACKYAVTLQQEEESAQQSLFGGSNGVDVPLPRLTDCEPYSEIEKLKIEKEVIGFYISGHPLDQFKLEIENFCTCTVDQVPNYKNQDISVAGIVTSFQERQTRTGKPFGLVTIEDYQTSLNLAFFGEDFLSNRHRLSIGEFVYIRGKVEERYNQPDVWELRPQSVQLLSEIREKMTKGVQLKIPVEVLDDKLVSDLEKLLLDYQGSCALKVYLQDGMESITVDTMSRKFKVNPVNSFFETVEKLKDITYKLEAN